MSSSSSPSVVPPCPQGLTIRREDFLSPSFTVDAFLTHWNTTSASSSASTGRPRSLETLRDDLGIYLKVLRSAMIELINEDYADFVNLSTNLVGLDKSIEGLEAPLIRHKTEVEEVRAALTATLDALHSKLKNRELLYSKKTALQNLEHITNTLNKVERILGVGGPDPVEMTGDLVERVAAEINHLNFCVSKCEASTFVNELQPRLKVIGDHLHGSLENQMLDAIGGQNVEVLRRCLRIFVTVDRAGDAEMLVRRKVIRPNLEECISDKSLSEDPLGLRGVFHRVMQIIPNQLSTLLHLTGSNNGRKKLQSSSASGEITATKALKDFDFLVNALWPEVVDLIEENISFIFSAGNPEKFFSNYQGCMSFLEDFERELGSAEAVEQFRETEPYKNFVSHWNLPVYFQIRFQEIALPVESSLSDAAIFKEESSPGSKFRLACTSMTLSSIIKCWDNSVYIDALAHRFWKLSMQIISRYAKGVSQAPDVKIGGGAAKKPASSTVTAEEERLKYSASSLSVKDQGHTQGHKRSSSDTSSEATGGEHQETFRSSTKDLINLYLDVSNLRRHISSSVLNETILPCLGDLTPSQTEAVSTGLNEGCRQLDEQLPVLSSIVINNVTGKCLSLLKQVSDIPRLYRRTNRDLPCKPCSYLTALLGPISSFHLAHTTVAPKEVMHEWLVAIFSVVSDQFFSNVSEVLAAVQKMEESLRRLKRVRDVKGGAAGASGGGGGGGPGVDGKGAAVSDDDKIRLQLYLDVRYFIAKMETDFAVEKSSVHRLTELEALVTEATASLEEARGKFVV